MKPVRNIIILVLVIALLGGGMYLINQYEPASEEPAPTSSPAITLFKTEKASITAVTVTRPDETYTLKKQGGIWVANDDPSIAISQSRTDTFLYECANITVQELIEENPQDVSQYGLDHPARTVRIEEADGTVTTVLIGNTSFDFSVSYVMLEGRQAVYTRSAYDSETLSCSLSELLDDRIYSMDIENVGGLTINRKGAEPIRLVNVNMTPDEETPSYEWYMEKPIHKEGNQYTITRMLLTNMVSQSALEIIPIPQNGVDYGFSDPQATYSIWNLDKTQTYTVTVGKEVGENTYLRLEGVKTVFAVPTEMLDFLQFGYLDLVDKLVHVENINEVSEVQLNGLGKSYTMSVSGEEDAAVYKINGKTVEEKNFKTAYQTVLGLTLNDIAKKSYTGKTEFTIRYLKKDGSESVLECVHYDDRNYLVLVNKEGNLLIRKKQIENLITTLDKTISE